MEKQTKNVLEIARLGGVLHDKLSEFSKGLLLVKQRLAQASEAHDESISRLKDQRGNIHVNIMVSAEQQSKQPNQIEAALDALFYQVIAWGGAITGEHGIGLAKKRWWREATSQELRDLHKAVKSALDPQDILTPGKFV